MCLAIVKTPGSVVPMSVLQDGFASNADGAGIAVARRGRLLTDKGFFRWKDFQRAYDRMVGEDDTALIHFRLATAGRINWDNCHPFPVGRRTAMIHNGVLPWRSTTRKSDTACFVSDVLSRRSSQLFDTGFRRDVESLIGERNKLAFLNADGDWTIYNEGSGEWHGGVWYSQPYAAWQAADDEWESTDDWDAACDWSIENDRTAELESWPPF